MVFYNNCIDLRSDTVTKPTKEMRKIISEANVGDELYLDDPNTKDLESFCAEYFGKESSLFCPSGMMANLIAIRCHTVAGDEVLADKNYHLFYYERSAVVDLTKVSIVYLPHSSGIITCDQLFNYFLSRRYHVTEPQLSLLWLENTISGLAGKIYPLTDLQKVYQAAKEIKLPVHLDGARLLNACVASGVSAKEYCKHTDSLIITFTKGLGAPFGAILIGDYKFIEKAKTYKKRFGGGMHQSGMMAAACKYVLENNIKKLSMDHQRAKLFIKLLNEDKELGLNVIEPETNITIIDISLFDMNVKTFIEVAKNKGLLLYPWNKSCVRAVFHSDINDKMVIEAVRIIREIKMSLKN